MRVGARSAAGSMSALSLTLNVREHRFQMCHYRGCAGDPLISSRGEPLSLLIFLCGGKESKCLPRTGANANNPISIQGKANAIGTQQVSAAQAN
jgi:hypothetical protein